MLSSMETSAAPVYCPASSYQASAFDKLGFQFTASSLYTHPLIIPPPSYIAATSMNTSFSSPPPYMMICREKASEMDADSNSLSSITYDTRMSDDDDEKPLDMPLDLSVRKKESLSAASSSTTLSTQARPSVIRNGYGERHVDMRRSASSVSSRPRPEPDVSEHFRRSLSGKWPRRQNNHGHYVPPQSDKERRNEATVKRHNSSPGYDCSRQTPPCCVSPSKNIIVKDYGVDIEEHFRRALGADKYEMLRKTRNLSKA